MLKILRWLLPKTKGEKIDLDRELRTQLVSVVHHDASISLTEWMKEMKVGCQYSVHQPYSCNESLEEMKKRFKKENIKNAQRQQVLNYQIKNDPNNFTLSFKYML